MRKTPALVCCLLLAAAVLPGLLFAASHQVRPGETLGGIARRHGVSVAQLRSWNNLRGDLIRPGQQLRVSAPGQPAPADTPADYVVVAGDTLGGIAQRHGVSVAQLRSWNNLRGDLIRPGQRLALGPGAATAHYTVRAGDTLGGIAARHRVSVAQLRSWNNLRGDLIRPGQRLALGPGAVPVDDRYVTRRDHHQVRRGENLGLIARRYGTTVANLRRLNNLRGDVIHPGQRLVVRVRRVLREQPPPVVEPSAIIRDELHFHTVRAGETIASLAEKYELDADYIRRVNLLSAADTLRPGQVLAISRPETDRESPAVENGVQEALEKVEPGEDNGNGVSAPAADRAPGAAETAPAAGEGDEAGDAGGPAEGDPANGEPSPDGDPPQDDEPPPGD